MWFGVQILIGYRRFDCYQKVKEINEKEFSVSFMNQFKKATLTGLSKTCG